MGTINPIDHLTIKGFKSIRNLKKLRLNSLNILIGANGVGKSNFVSYFRLLGEMLENRLQLWTSKQGGADRVLTYGVKDTSTFSSFVEFGINGYLFDLAPTADSGFTFSREALFFHGPYYGDKWVEFGSGHTESKLKGRYESTSKGDESHYCFDSISSWRVYHFHDTSESAGVKRLGSLHDNEYLRADASNLSAFLYRLKEKSPNEFQLIRKTIRLAIPFFDDFVLKPQALPSEEQQIRLLWRHKDNDGLVSFLMDRFDLSV